MRILSRVTLFSVLAALADANAATTAISPDQLAFFEQRVRPVLVEHCYECHSANSKKLKGGLHVDSKLGLLKGGDSGKPSIVAGEPDHSPLIKAVRHEDPDLQMPPKKKLTEKQIADLTVWVKAGAPDPREGKSEAKRADKSWWSLQKLTAVTPSAPAEIPEAWKASPIDRFVFTGLKEKELTPNGPADRRALIRRATYDLLGLPPTPGEVAAFETDKQPDAYERLIDRLLASPRYGEHWGRHWLDVVRFGESIGFERNGIIDNAWPFRDYVIRSFNDDKPFNQFIVEHIAGDVVGKDKPEVEVGTAFLVTGPFDNVGNRDPVAAAQIRANTLDDIITATGTAFLGITINCARCHHHKFDPIPQEDYYRMQAAFAGVRHAARVLATPEERKKHVEVTRPLEARLKQLNADKDKLEGDLIALGKELNAPKEAGLRPAPQPELTEETFPAVEARYVRLNMLATSASAKSGTGARMDEFEVWTAEATPRNAALAANGGKAEGAASRQAQDFANAYDVSLVIDGKFGARWFVGAPAELTVAFAKAEKIDRISFSNLRNVTTAGGNLGAYVAEYEVLVSLDGKQWTKVADSFDRKTVTAAQARERNLRLGGKPDDFAKLGALQKQITETSKELEKIPALPLVWAGAFAETREVTYLQKGGDPQKRGDDIAPASLKVLEDAGTGFVLATNAPEKERRMALARWIASNDNPLTARVLVNRVWHYHFGVGIVDTPSDFGYLGGTPTHPQLLDWLALRLQHHGWQLKPLHREIMLSQTYRQSADYRVAAAGMDKDGRYLWRFPPRRLEAEEIRDTLLAVAGKLDTKLGGPGFRLYQYLEDNVSTYVPLDNQGPETYRRAVYHQNARASVVDLLTDFDAPDAASATPRRASTTSPLQALTLLNHSFTLDMAAALAARLEKEAGANLHDQVKRAFALAFNRAPEAHELESAARVVKANGLKVFCRALLNANELIYLE